MNEKQKEILESLTGYYTFPFSGDGFEGDIIKLDPQSFNILFQKYTDGNEERYRAKLERWDSWFFDKPYKVYSNWVQYIVKWLERDYGTDI